MAKYIDIHYKGAPGAPTLRAAMAVETNSIIALVTEVGIAGDPDGAIDPDRCGILGQGKEMPDGMMTVEDSFDAVVERLRTA